MLQKKSDETKKLDGKGNRLLTGGDRNAEHKTGIRKKMGYK